MTLEDPSSQKHTNMAQQREENDIFDLLHDEDVEDMEDMMDEDEQGGGETQADVERSHAKWCGGRDWAPVARRKGAKSKRMGL